MLVRPPGLTWCVDTPRQEACYGGPMLPLPDASVQLVTASMSLHDIDDMDAAVSETARVLVSASRCASRPDQLSREVHGSRT